MQSRKSARQLAAGSRDGAGPVRYLRTVLRSRPVCRAIADTDQPRRANAWISTSSSSVSIPSGASIQIAGVRTSDPGGGPRQTTRAVTRSARAYGPSLRELPRQGRQEWGILAIRCEELLAIGGIRAQRCGTW